MPIVWKRNYDETRTDVHSIAARRTDPLSR
jgi:hypothetical protein